ncbi:MULTISPECIES: EfeM/EfeO family lipoprotein [Streptacidiphilus]|uniref:EfeM/EfeO family lipoprotein n=1 Tax=Streptacidiphilus cavernicola TaxID=3342716 RepID=A0ABV6UQN6_9ACTN|nr:EfeM/EfeO family lipoprotein [Streptacidiphilus jeojiense]
MAALAVVSGCGGSAPARTAAVADDYPGLPHTTVQVSPGGCGVGWTKPQAGLQVFEVSNTGPQSEEAYLKNPATGAVLGEVEELGPGTTRSMVVRLAAGKYAFSCLPQDVDTITGPTVVVPGTGGTDTPGVVPVTQQDLVPPTLAYQKWVAAQLPALITAVQALQAAVDSGDVAAAEKAWLPAHLDYERLGAAYGTFGDLDGSINGTTKGLPGGLTDPGFTGFHRLEYGLWHGQSAASLRPVAAQLTKDVQQLRTDWAKAQMDPLDLGLRAHEIVENTIQFELTARTDYGSGSNLATAQANLQGTAESLSLLRPLLVTRMPSLPAIDTAMKAASNELSTLGRVPLSTLSTAEREQLNAVFGELVTELAPVAAVCDVRRTS